MTQSASSKIKKVNLALQGGGSHGAFTWGALNRILDDDRLEVEAISGTSAGAINAAIYADGYTKAGKKGAREALETFWRRISVSAQVSPIQRNPISTWMEKWNADMTPGYIMFDMMTRLLSPYQMNPFNYNPLRLILEDTIDFKRLHDHSAIKLFVSATNINRGIVRIFEHDEIDADVLMASSCLPYLFQAVEIDGEYYWDGGYMGNPSIFPLIYKCGSEDVIIVKINNLQHEGVPKTSVAILDRLNEISFNASLIGEMRAVRFVQKLIEQNKLDPHEYKDMHIHIIEAEDYMEDLGTASKLNADWAFLTHLRDIGYQAADSWIKENYKDIGKKSTVNLDEKFTLKTSNIQKKKKRK